MHDLQRPMWCRVQIHTDGFDLGEMEGMMIGNEVDSGVEVGRWDMQQAELVNAIIVAAQRRGPNKRHFGHRRTGSSSLHGTGSDLGKFVPVLNADTFLRAGRLVLSVADELVIRCGEVRNLAHFLKRSFQVISFTGAIRLRGLR